MPDPFSLAGAIALLVKHAPDWLHSLEETLAGKGKDLASRRIQAYFNEKKQVQHMELALQNAAERGIAQFSTLEERDQYRDILHILSEPGPHSEALRREAIRLFTLSDSPNLEDLKETYNRSLRFRTLTQPVAPDDVDVIPYLISFFNSLLAELYIDPLFNEQISDVLQVRSALSMQRSLTEIITTLNQIGEMLASGYTSEQLEQDVASYAAHVERAHRYLKLVGIVPKDQSDEDTDPELDAIFVPLHIAYQDQKALNEQSHVILVDLFKDSPCSVLLGGPGSGKSTTTRYLAWSHAVANLQAATLPQSGNMPLLPGKPLPLRIELRRLTEDRRHHPHYSFLSYTTEVLLGRADLHISQQMFEQLLERRAMLVLFDGLDEVATLDERLRLVEEIEEFTLRYPGNRFLVTSRPVGYETAHCSRRLFAHFLIQELDDQQMRTFLEHWYTHVRRLSPLPPEDQQELEILYETLTKNPRLHALAANPLLLTVMTTLHRYERLPDRRVQVYDRCADLLLNIWAKLRGTVARWKDMTMSKEIQYACIAYLGFILHTRSQRKDSSSNDPGNDVSTRFMLQEIKHFLASRDLFSVAERHLEAERFLELIQTEAGLIVEFGTDENGEPLYGFVHRTFQEYFAATHIYELYQEEENANIIGQFLAEHLYDPHWNEVILLLFGKLKVKPATLQLRQLLEKSSSLSKHTDLLHQNLFFACTCLSEEVVVEHELAKSIASHLSDLANNSLFPTQRAQALEALTILAGTRQYGSLARKELMPLITQNLIPDTPSKIKAVQVLHEGNSSKSEEWQQTIKMLLNLAQQPDLTVEQVLQIAESLYKKSSFEAEERQQAIHMFLNLAQQPSLSFKEAMSIAQALYQVSSNKSKERNLIIQALLNLLHQPDLSFSQWLHVALILYRNDWLSSDQHQQMSQRILDLTQSPDFSSEQGLKEVLAFYGWSSESPKSTENEIIYPLLLTLVQRPDLPFQQALNAGVSFYNDPQDDYHNYYEDEVFANQLLLSLAQRPDFSFEQAMQVAQAFSGGYLIPQLVNYAQESNLSIPRRVLVTRALYVHSDAKSYEEQQAIQMLWQLLQESCLTIAQKLSLVAIPLKKVINDFLQEVGHRGLTNFQIVNYQDRANAVRVVLTLLQKEDAKQFIEKHWQPINVSNFTNEIKYKVDASDIPSLIELAKQDVLPMEERDKIYRILRELIPQLSSEDTNL